VGEEGLDFQPCKLVIKFDVTKNLSSYIQSRGRARHKDSQYLVFVMKGDAGQMAIFNNVRECEKTMKQACERACKPTFTVSAIHFAH
jgi:endoribonuclease Dicer